MPQDKDLDDVLASVASAAKRLNAAEEVHREAASELARVMHTAHERGCTWTQIAQQAGLGSPNTARTRAERAMDPADLSPSVRWRQERSHAPRPKPEAPGVSVTEAAKRLGITRHTVYAWINQGKLRSAADEAGRPRVLLDEG